MNIDVPEIAAFVYLYVTLVCFPLSYMLASHAIRRFRRKGRRDWAAWFVLMMLALVMVIGLSATWFALLRLIDRLDLAQVIPFQIGFRAIGGMVLTAMLCLYFRPRTVALYVAAAALISAAAVIVSQHYSLGG